MNETEVIRLLRDYAAQYNDWKYFTGDPIIFPKHFAGLMAEGRATLQDVEVAAAVAAHLAWGRREMIVRDCRRAMDEMGWQPYEYVMAGKYRSDSTSLHRTVRSTVTMRVSRSSPRDRCASASTGRRTTLRQPTRRFTC